MVFRDELQKKTGLVVGFDQNRSWLGSVVTMIPLHRGPGRSRRWSQDFEKGR